MNQIAKVGEVLPTKSNITEKANEIVSLVNDGEVSAIEIAIKLKAIMLVCEEALSAINENVVTEVSKFGKSTESLGVKLEVKEVGTKWDYSTSDAWKSIKLEEDKLAEKRKQIEDIAKKTPVGAVANWTDTETGELLTIKTGLKTSKTSFAITIPKS